MIRFPEQKRNLARGIIRIMRACREAGEIAAAELPSQSAGRCDLCNAKPTVGRLLLGDCGLEFRVHTTMNEIEFVDYVPDDPVEGMFWVCRPCFRLLHQDVEELVARILRDPEAN
jgi:hypothetical protein